LKDCEAFFILRNFGATNGALLRR